MLLWGGGSDRKDYMNVSHIQLLTKDQTELIVERQWPSQFT